MRSTRTCDLIAVLFWNTISYSLSSIAYLATMSESSGLCSMVRNENVVTIMSLWDAITRTRASFSSCRYLASVSTSDILTWYIWCYLPCSSQTRTELMALSDKARYTWNVSLSLGFKSKGGLDRYYMNCCWAFSHSSEDTPMDYFLEFNFMLYCHKSMKAWSKSSKCCSAFRDLASMPSMYTL